MDEYNKYLSSFELFVPLTENQKAILNSALRSAYLDGQIEGMDQASKIFNPPIKRVLNFLSQ